MHQLYPIIRRKRRPLIQADAPSVITLPVTESVKPTAEPVKIITPKKPRDNAPKN